MSHTLDTNILINMTRLYPRDIFPALWESLESLVAAGECCICQAVLTEIHRGGDDLHKWAKDLPAFVCEATDGEMVTVAEIAVAHPQWVQEQLNEADPFVIAHAKAEHSVLVTEENRKGPGVIDKNQKIPNIADEHNVHVIKFFEFVRAQGWQF